MDSMQTSRTEDHALERVPLEQRQSWLALSWNTAGIVTTLVQLFFGALVTFAAGFRLALLAGFVVAAIGATLGWLVGHVGYKSGLSSTVLARHYGFGRRGSIVASVIFAFMIIGFLALENALLYKGILFYFAIDDTIWHRAAVYGLLSAAWILLTAYGFKLVTRVSSLTLLLFLGLLVWITGSILGSTQPESLLSFGAQLPAAALDALGAATPLGKFTFAVNVLIGSAGALALVDADLGRYARRSRDIGLAAVIGNLFMDVVMVALGGILMYAATGALTDFYVQQRGFTHAAAQAQVLSSPDSVAAVLIMFGGLWGTILMFLAQGKAQVLNTYSASLSLANLGEALLGRNIGRLTWVVVANLIGLLMLYGDILALVNQYITLLGILTTSFAGLIIADFYLVRGRVQASGEAPSVNWPGLVTIAVAPFLAHALAGLVPFQFVTVLATTLLLYPFLLRIWPRPLRVATSPR